MDYIETRGKNKEIEKDRRQNKRFVFMIPQTLNSKPVGKLHLINLSINGAELLLPENSNPSIGQTIEGHIPLPAGIKGIDFKGRIIWISNRNRKRCGIAFEEMPESEQMVIQAYLDYLERDKIIYNFKKVVNNYLTCIRTLVELYTKKQFNKEIIERQQVKYLH